LYFFPPRVQRCSKLSKRELIGFGGWRGAPRRVSRPVQVAHARAGQLAGDRDGRHGRRRRRRLLHRPPLQGVHQARRRRRAVLMFDQTHVARLQRLVVAAPMGVHLHPRVILLPDSLIVQEMTAVLNFLPENDRSVGSN